MTAPPVPPGKSSLLDAAIAYARRGWAVFPLAPGTKIPLFANAHAEGDSLRGKCRGECGREGHGFYDASTDATKVATWWRDTPRANIGVRTGAESGIDVLDLDEKDGRHGRATIGDLESDFGQIETLTSVTPTAGLHLIFQHAYGVGCGTEVLPGCDLRADGGYIVAPPSIVSGKVYAWLDGQDSLRSPILAWPAWLLSSIDMARRNGPTKAVARPKTPEDSTATSYGAAALRRLSQELAASLKGTRDDRRNSIAFRAGRLIAGGHVPRAEAERALFAACEINGLAEELGETETRARIARAIADGIAAGPTGPAADANEARVTHRNQEAGPADEAAASLPWRTLREVAQDATEKPRDWEWPGLLALRTVAVLSGEPKAGKSEILAAFLAAKTLGTNWLGKPIGKGRVVLVTEEGDHDLVAKMLAYGADADSVFVLSRDVVVSPPLWATLVANAVAKALEVGATILVIDTFSFWAAIEGEGERVEGIVRDALQVLQAARNAGLATALVHHNVKAKDVEGIAALRGSGAFAASVETVAIFRRHSTNLDDAKRKLEVFSRIAACATTTVERVLEDGGSREFRVVDPLERKASGAYAADTKIASAISQIGGWVDRKALPEATGLSDRTLDARLPVLIEGGRLVRRGRGVPGDGFKYAIPGTPFPADETDASGTAPQLKRGGHSHKRPMSASPQVTAKSPHCGDSAGADSPITEAPHPPTGERAGAVIERGEAAAVGRTSPHCGDRPTPPLAVSANPETQNRTFFETEPDVREARRLREEGGAA